MTLFTHQYFEKGLPMANRRPVLTVGQKYAYYRRGIFFGADGSIVGNDRIIGNDWVYVISMRKIVEIDYFHGCHSQYGGEPMCQTAGEEEDYPSNDLLSQTGFVAKAITKVQQAYRSRHREQE